MSLQPDKEGKLDYSAFQLNSSLADNLALLAEIFRDDVTFQQRELRSRTDATQYALLFCDGMVGTRLLNDDILKPVQESRLSRPGLKALMEQLLPANSAVLVTEVGAIVEAIVSGDSAVLMEGEAGAVVVNTKGYAVRAVSEPDDEKSLRGPREGFNESLMTNVSLLRRKLQTSDLKFKSLTLGTRSNTKAFLCYLDSLADKSVLAELERRLADVCVDGVLDVNYLQEYIKDGRRSIFKTCGSTEKPDIVAAKLLEGRIALILDGTPIVLTVPYLFIENFQAADDYYIGFYFGSLGRLLRLIGFLITISAPAVYISLVAFHPEMIPTQLMISMAAAISKVPFPTVVECVMMLLVFEVLRETGIRTPGKIGQALSVVGALIVGQAAVEARLVSAPVVIIVALTGITALMIPRMGTAVLVMRGLLLLGAAFFGYYGYIMVLLALFFYLCGMKSFGLDYLSQMLSYSPPGGQDIYIRRAMPGQRRRPLGMSRDGER